MMKSNEEKNQLEKVGFFLLGMVMMACSSSYTLWLSEKFNLVEHKVDYVNVVSHIPVFDTQVEAPKERIRIMHAKVYDSNPDLLSSGARSISKEGMAFIKQNEGIAKQAFWDVNGITVGWGHKINRDDPKWLRDMKIGQWITKTTADELFYKDIAEFVNPSISHMMKDLESNGVDTKILKQEVVDGLADLIYNCGLGGVMSSDFYNMLKTGKINKAISMVPSTRVYCKAHKERRRKTYELMSGL